jgi:hypothetical protein
MPSSDEITQPLFKVPFSMREAQHSYVAALDRLSKAESGDIQEIAASQIQLLKSFYDLALGQARKSFKWALVSAGVGLAFLLGAVTFLLLDKSLSVATVSVVSGALVEIIAGVNFYLYSKAVSQLSMFHLRLDFTQRILLANSLCEGLSGESKEKARSGLIASLALQAECEWRQAHNTVGRADG